MTTLDRPITGHPTPPDRRPGPRWTRALDRVLCLALAAGLTWLGWTQSLIGR